MKTLIQFPTRSRPEQFLETLDAWWRTSVEFHVVIDVDDPSMNNAAMRRELATRGIEDLSIIEPAGKIAAMNHGLADRPWDIVILAQDDMLPVGNYPRVIEKLFAAHAPDLDLVLHPSDGRRSDELNTTCIVGRKYFDRFGYLYHPQYQSLWADNEFTDVSQALLRALRVKQTILVHQWIGESAPDALLAANERHFAADQAIYRRRKALGFPPQFVK